MPYYVFRLSSDKPPELVDSFVKFQEAMNVCRELRARAGPGSTKTIRMAFGANEKEAKRLLSDKRQPSSPLEEWES
jgi:L-lysine 2,3-aminomutase